MMLNVKQSTYLNMRMHFIKLLKCNFQWQFNKHCFTSTVHISNYKIQQKSFYWKYMIKYFATIQNPKHTIYYYIHVYVLFFTLSWFQTQKGFKHCTIKYVTQKISMKQTKGDNSLKMWDPLDSTHLNQPQ